MFERRSLNRRGFTLVELLVVVAIIALLMSILLPSLSKARETARGIGCASNMRQLLMANHMYADSQDGWYVPVQMMPWSLPETVWAWNSGYRSMLGLNKVEMSDLDHGDGDLHGSYPPGMACPDVPDERKNINGDRVGDLIHSYGSNFTLWWEDGGYSSAERKYFVQNQQNGSFAYQRVAIEQPSSNFLFVDANEWWVNSFAANYLTNWEPFGESRQMKSVTYRHNEGINAGYFDGHATHRSKEEVGDPAKHLDKIWSISD